MNVVLCIELLSLVKKVIAQGICNGSLWTGVMCLTSRLYLLISHNTSRSWSALPFAFTSPINFQGDVCSKRKSLIEPSLKTSTV